MGRERLVFLLCWRRVGAPALSRVPVDWFVVDWRLVDWFVVDWRVGAAGSLGCWV